MLFSFDHGNVLFSAVSSVDPCPSPFVNRQSTSFWWNVKHVRLEHSVYKQRSLVRRDNTGLRAAAGCLLLCHADRCLFFSAVLTQSCLVNGLARQVLFPSRSTACAFVIPSCIFLDFDCLRQQVFVRLNFPFH